MLLSRLITVLFFLCAALSLKAAVAVDVLEAWQGFSSPDILSSGFTHSYYSLPQEGSTDYNGPRFWSADYWPSKVGGINHRWYSSRPAGFRTNSPKRNEVLRMNSNQLAALAPSEKYDILMGRYDYPLKKQVAASVSETAQDWEGICHGWVVAALHHSEPTPKYLTNSDGVVVPFGSSDIKALITYYYAIDQGNAPTVGRRCNFGQWTGGETDCDQDLNAGAFHIIIANRIGLARQGLIMDVERLDQVWNQPVIAYSSKVTAEFTPGRDAARGTVREFRLTTQVWYVNEIENNWERVQGTALQKFDTKVLQYRIELNRNDEIIGGTWESKERPDFIWHKEKAQRFDGYFFRLPTLLNDDSFE